jgi:hypothetical protein
MIHGTSPHYESHNLLRGATLMLVAFVGSPAESASGNPFHQLKGYWSCGGTVNPLKGIVERVDRRVTYRVEGSAVAQNMRCAGTAFFSGGEPSGNPHLRVNTSRGRRLRSAPFSSTATTLAHAPRLLFRCRQLRLPGIGGPPRYPEPRGARRDPRNHGGHLLYQRRRDLARPASQKVRGLTGSLQEQILQRLGPGLDGIVSEVGNANRGQHLIVDVEVASRLAARAG